MTTTSMRRSVAVPGTALLIAMSGCATPERPPALAPIAVAVPAPPPRPILPAGVPERLAVPVRDAAGVYRTINYALTPDRAAWHVRSALNVAVLSCRGPDELVIAADYNALLKRQKAPLATAYAQVQAGFRRDGGANWQSAQDAYSTRVYNFFALPPAKTGFCAAATALLAESRTVDPAAFAAFAQAALPRLEAPFTDVYRRYDAYRLELAAWQAQQAGGTMLAQTGAMPVPVPVPARPQAQPRLDYVGLDTLMDWQPPVARRNEQLASVR